MRPWVVLVERSGRVRAHHVQEVTARTLGPILAAQLDGASYVYTEEVAAIKTVGGELGQHAAANHSIGEYVRGDVRSNTIEGRSARGVEDAEDMTKSIQGIVGKASLMGTHTASAGDEAP